MGGKIIMVGRGEGVGGRGTNYNGKLEKLISTTYKCRILDPRDIDEDVKAVQGANSTVPIL